MNRTIIIDPGHGGIENGVLGFMQENVITEKMLALKVALIVKKFLIESHGFSEDEIFLTREDDSYVHINKRIECINNSDGYGGISIHFRTSNLEENEGFATFIPHIHNEKVMNLQEIIHTELVKASKKVGITANLGKHQSQSNLLQNIFLPFIEVNLGYLSSPTELQILITEEYQREIGKGIAQGLANYVKYVKATEAPPVSEEAPIKSASTKKVKEKSDDAPISTEKSTWFSKLFSWRKKK